MGEPKTEIEKFNAIYDHLMDGLPCEDKEFSLKRNFYVAFDEVELPLTPDSLPTSPIPESSSTPAPDFPCDPNEWSVRDRHSGRQRSPLLFEFLLLLLNKPHYESYASYTDRSAGVFHIHQPNEVAALWEKVKCRQSNNPMTYEKFARAIRWYYKRGTMKKTNARYTFQFGSKASITDENNNSSRNHCSFDTIRKYC